jgi:hypothetical protein
MSRRRCEAVVGLELLAGDDGGLEVLGDTAYGTGQARADLAAAGHTAIIKPGPLNPPAAGGFTVDDFTVNEQAGPVTCPRGMIRRITPQRSVTFGVACRGCPLRAVHDQQDRPHPDPAPARRPAAPGPP